MFQKKTTVRTFWEIYEDRQAESESTENLLCRNRTLIAELLNGFNREELQIDMIYGLLKKSVCERVPPQTI